MWNKAFYDVHTGKANPKGLPRTHDSLGGRKKARNSKRDNDARGRCWDLS